MNEPKAYASLSSGLLARKGAAKPAMRPQAFGQVGGAPLEDLGWNDMGYAPPPAPAEEHVPSSIAALTPAPRPVRADEEELASEPTPPVVFEQQRAIAETFGAADAPAPRQKRGKASPNSAEVVSLPSGAVPQLRRGKAAFTLRLDPDRHFRLRLACALTGRSAQQLVSGALDQWLESVPEIDALAERMPAAGTRRN